MTQETEKTTEKTLPTEQMATIRMLQPEDYEAAFVEPRMVGVVGLYFAYETRTAHLAYCRENSWYSAGWWLVLRASGEEERFLEARSKQKGRKMALDWVLLGMAPDARRKW